MFVTDRRKSSPLASRAYPGAPSCVWPVGLASVLTGLDTAVRVFVLLNFAMTRRGSLLTVGEREPRSRDRARDQRSAKPFRPMLYQLSYPRRLEHGAGLEPATRGVAMKNSSPSHRARALKLFPPEIKAATGH